MTQHFSLMIAQFNPSLGDLEKNAQRIEGCYLRSLKKGVNLIAFPEMFLTGYQAQDLILKEAFLSEVDAKIEKLRVNLVGDTAILVGAPRCENKKIYKENREELLELQ